ncbi:MAG: hypothetical protein JOY84_19170 [Curvibacter sp.]|nr:hypothetical protein [Curvibacter sp.]
MPARPCLHAQALRYAGWVLAMLLLGLASAAAAPLLHRHDLRGSICSANPTGSAARPGIRSDPPGTTTPDCPLCLPLLAMPSGAPRMAAAGVAPPPFLSWAQNLYTSPEPQHRPPVRAPPLVA